MIVLYWATDDHVSVKVQVFVRGSLKGEGNTYKSMKFGKVIENKHIKRVSY